MNFGPWEIAIVVLVVMLLFGAKAVPKIGRSAGKTMREFKDSVGDLPKEFKDAVETPAELVSTVRNPKRAVKDALNPFKSEEEALAAEEQLTDDEIRELRAALSGRGTAAEAETVGDVIEAGAGDVVVESEPARPVE